MNKGITEELMREVRNNVEAYRVKQCPPKREKKLRNRYKEVLQDYTIMKIYRCYLRNGREVTLDNMNITNVVLNQIIIKCKDAEQDKVVSIALGHKNEAYMTEEEMLNGYVAPSYEELSEIEKEMYNAN
jgi:hypothetical protein